MMKTLLFFFSLSSVHRVHAARDDVYFERDCVWGRASNPSLCSSAGYEWRYPECALFKYSDGSPVPCNGNETDWCRYESATPSPRPRPASYHLHVMFPNDKCTNCTVSFSKERTNFTFKGAMRFRSILAEKLNSMFGGKPRMDVKRAAADIDYNQCGDEFGIVAGAPVNYHSLPCIFEVDDSKRLGPFTNPSTGGGYPNYSFLLPGDSWYPGIVSAIKAWLVEYRQSHPEFALYTLLIHPNTGCEKRDHVEEASVIWMGDPLPLLWQIFSCNTLGCNQGCAQQGNANRHPEPSDC